MATSQDADSDMECSDNEDGYYDYNDYYNDEDSDIERIDPTRVDPEYFDYKCLSEEEVERLLNETVESLSNRLIISPSLAKVLLHSQHWNTNEVIHKYKENPQQTLIGARINPPSPPKSILFTSTYLACSVCITTQNIDKFFHLSCAHIFCRECWTTHFEVQISQGISTAISCMAKDCIVLAPEDFVLKHLHHKTSIREKYQHFIFQDYVKAHPELRFCPGPNCSIIIHSSEIKAKRAVCTQCKTIFCFRCGCDYHAPTDCQVIKKWLTKCADDSETANYISAHTKDCPKCHICIEKNGGCNHMQCYNCKHDFCWMCLGDWKSHGSEYYECSRYRENPNIAHESVHAQAREALKKYLHYYERWENHSKSLKLEEQTLEKLRDRINQKVMSGLGTWIDWQYLFTAANLLAKCRYTLQYTYPFAYYMDAGPRKELFEYQQAQLEAEIENLSWKVERAETTDRGDLENQMDIAEKRRTTLLKDFLDV
ncbi:potential E3 ubiquitin-protein ligase ariadne-2 [Dendroctonus ponderosae]|uniref:RBR-type E3 ubiquitin transferase n=1 Tax=Dendroctonus ponderosae TaxID=77166 RepID=A0AAR5P2V5_DENPD|nr:potential E3 ubiquitin-protein ligase ariadne-2 [Dendroctonus ponderosae]KAH1023008.1 hypothetical protein HUJ04_012299 [Dendroctonus ponderosae]KAH1029465.1 hypothetical protein HUJ05_002703 [Dendroctonus ponderosae]